MHTCVFLRVLVNILVLVLLTGEKGLWSCESCCCWTGLVSFCFHLFLTKLFRLGPCAACLFQFPTVGQTGAINTSMTNGIILHCGALCSHKLNVTLVSIIFQFFPDCPTCINLIFFAY